MGCFLRSRVCWPSASRGCGAEDDWEDLWPWEHEGCVLQAGKVRAVRVWVLAGLGPAVTISSWPSKHKVNLKLFNWWEELGEYGISIEWTNEDHDFPSKYQSLSACNRAGSRYFPLEASCQTLVSSAMGAWYSAVQKNPASRVGFDS